MAATRTGAASRPIAISATPQREAATDGTFALGSVGAGLGATTANFKGGLGSASARTADGVTRRRDRCGQRGRQRHVGDGPWFWAAPFEHDNEFGGRGCRPPFTPDMLAMRLKGAPPTAIENTTLAVVVTDAMLTKAQAKRLAVMAQTGLARAIYPVHTPLDGDVVFAAATGEKPIDPLYGLDRTWRGRRECLARAIARGVYEAKALPFAGALPSWKMRFEKSD